MRFVTGVDIGGTFTDFVTLDRQRDAVYTEKILTTPDSPAKAVIEGLQALGSKHGVGIDETGTLLHATTLASNAVIERKGVVTGLLTTTGFEDVLDIAKGLRYDQYDLKIQLPLPYVPRSLREGIDERVLADGRVHQAPSEQQVVQAARELVEMGIRSLAICLLHSYANPAHELKVRELIQREFPSLPVSLSHEVSPQIREYERMSTTVIDAYTKPIVREYLSDLADRLERIGFVGKLLIMTCSGGVIDRQVAERLPVLLLESGPVAGVSMAAEVARGLPSNGIFSFDMGGTTAKGCVVRNRTIEKAYEFEAARSHKFRRGSGIPVSVPVVRLIEIGSGGGSIATVDELGLVRVGPDSAGANPGPACYGLGGKSPTVTDADLLLGYLDADFFLGGAMKLRADLAKEAIERTISPKARLAVEEAAWAVHDRINEDVAAAFRLHASEVGIDYRRFFLLSFGGAGPVHAARISKKLNAKGVVIPPKAGVLSAAGLLVTPLSVDIAQTKKSELSELSFEEYKRDFRELVSRATSRISSAGVRIPDLLISRHLDMRYHGQGYDIEVKLGGRITRNEFLQLPRLFERAYESKYSIAGISKSIDITAFKVTVSARGETLSPQVLGGIRETARPRTRKPAYDHGSRRLKGFDVVSRYSLGKGDHVRGPALVQELESTCVVPSGWRAAVDSHFNLVLEGKIG
jgi:N-methylhydantoinase A